MEILFVYIFDGPRKHVDLLEQLIDVCNNPAIRAEDDPGTARSKQTTSGGRKLRAMTAAKSQGGETCVTRDIKLYERTIHVHEHRKKDRLFKYMSHFFVTAF